ncbi:MAG TPA: YbaY family lipoprotein [Rhodanobacteraceae bacterium]|nr:YbaY family lipoprotein [Rhodanobacteraceae bacterium]
MQKLAAAPWLLAALILAGCNASNSSGGGESATTAAPAVSQAGMPATAATAVTGAVTVPNPPTPITAQAVLELSLVNVSKQPGVTVNKQDFRPPVFPQAFRIPFSASAINPNDLYVLQATMQDGGRTYSTRLQQPVLTRGQPANVDLVLVAEPTAAEKMLDAFNQAKRQTGGMAVKSGTSSKIGESHSWQVFRNDQGIQFIIEQTNQADKGFTKSQYAYRDGLPWVVVQEQMPKADASPTSTARVGWGDNGVLVLNQKLSGGKTGTLSNAETRALHDQAEAQYERFSKKR